MLPITIEQRRRLASHDRHALVEHQLRRLNAHLEAILPANAFYAEKLADFERPIHSLDQFAGLPFTFKEELLHSRGRAGYAANLSFEPRRYVRWHQTSGTRGRPLALLDTADDWQWWTNCWHYVLDAVDATADDTAFMAFSFGPFIGFWSAHDTALERGCLVVPGGGMHGPARLELLRSSGATLLFCTPSYALHLAEIAADRAIDVRDLPVRAIILAGEPGGSVPAVRDRIERAWNARTLDHAGATEVGAWGVGDREQRGLHVVESEFIAEFLSIVSGEPAEEGELAELVITALGRVGAPVIRYRTGDVVRPVWRHDLPTRFVLLEGGVVGRTDDMLVVRGVNVFPTAIEQILRSFPEVLEYRITVAKQREMDQLRVEIEDRLAEPDRVADELRLRLGLRVDVRTVPLGSLPRFEGKGRRFIDERQART